MSVCLPACMRVCVCVCPYGARNIDDINRNSIARVLLCVCVNKRYNNQRSTEHFVIVYYIE